MSEDSNRLACSLIATHGADALNVARSAVENARFFGRAEQEGEWLRVVDAIKAILKSDWPRSGASVPDTTDRDLAKSPVKSCRPAPMRDPRSSEILEWIDLVQPAADRLKVLQTMAFAFPSLTHDRGWKARIAMAAAQLRPSLPQKYRDEAARVRKEVIEVANPDARKVLLAIAALYVHLADSAEG